MISWTFPVAMPTDNTALPQTTVLTRSQATGGAETALKVAYLRGGQFLC